MKQAQRIVLLFTGFVGLFSGVKAIDGYSADYLQCSQAWRAEIEQAKADPLLVEDTRSRLERDRLNTESYQACPGLWPDHKDRLMAELDSIG